MSDGFNAETLNPYLGQSVSAIVVGNMITRIRFGGEDIPFVATDNPFQAANSGACGTAADMDTTPQNVRKRLRLTSSNITPSSGDSQTTPKLIGESDHEGESPEIAPPRPKSMRRLRARSSTGSAAPSTGNGIVDDSENDDEAASDDDSMQ